MNIVRSITYNFSALMIAQIVTFALAFVLRIFLGRYLGDVGMGKLAFALSFSTMVTVLAGLGQGPFLTKEIAKNREVAGILVTNAAFVRAAMLLLVCLPLGLIVPLLPHDDDTKTLLYLVTLSMAIGSFTHVIISSVFRAHERMALSSIGLVLEKVVLTVASVSLLLAGFSVVEIGWVYVGGALGNFALSFYLLLRLAKPLLTLRLQLFKEIISGGLPFFVFAVFGTIYQRIDATMLSFMTHDAVVGWYSVAFGLYETLAFLPSTFQLILFPILARLHFSDKASFKTTLSKAFDLFSIITMPIAFGAFTLAPQIIELLFPLESFANSIILFRILATSMILLFFNILFGTALMAMDKQKSWSAAAVIAAFINPALNLFLIPYFQDSTGNGAIGAALATEGVEIMLLLVAIRLLPKGIITKHNLFVLFRALLAALLMAGVVWALQENNLFLLVALGALIYLGTSVLLKTINRQDIGFIWLAVKKRETPSVRQKETDLQDKVATS